MEEVRGGPSSGADACKRAIIVVEDVSVRDLISDLDRNSSRIEIESREVCCTGS